MYIPVSQLITKCYLTLNLIVILMLISMEILKSIKHSMINSIADLQNLF